MAGIKNEILKDMGDYKEANLDFAHLDIERGKRCGVDEVIYAPGKTFRQIIAIIREFKKHRKNILITKIAAGDARKIKKVFPFLSYNKTGRLLMYYSRMSKKFNAKVAVVCAGTADVPVAEEAAATAEWLGLRVLRTYDVGVAGLHRLLRRVECFKKANVVIVVAGMEGALPSVVGGLIDKPVIAVPTSVGYGANFKGISALLTMLNSCVPGITVANIDNGFGAAVAAAAICRQIEGAV
jgi:NCAIR mutase (PurE)-related protein